MWKTEGLMQDAVLIYIPRRKKQIDNPQQMLFKCCLAACMCCMICNTFTLISIDCDESCKIAVQIFTAPRIKWQHTFWRNEYILELMLAEGDPLLNDNTNDIQLWFSKRSSPHSVHSPVMTWLPPDERKPRPIKPRTQCLFLIIQSISEETNAQNQS